jgi:hypothetical protein
MSDSIATRIIPSERWAELSFDSQSIQAAPCSEKLCRNATNLLVGFATRITI